MTPIMDALELLTAQHAQIDDLFDHVAMLRDPDALSELADTLTTHLAAEQELLYPAMTTLLDREVLEELHAEHAEIRRTLANLVWFGVDDPDFDTRLRQLGTLLDGHVGYQEETLFPIGATSLAADKLSHLGSRMASAAQPFLYGRALPLAS